MIKQLPRGTKHHVKLKTSLANYFARHPPNEQLLKKLLIFLDGKCSLGCFLFFIQLIKLLGFNFLFKGKQIELEAFLTLKQNFFVEDENCFKILDG